MTAAEAGFSEIFLDRAADGFRQRDERNEVAGGRVRVGEAELLALEVFELGDARILAGDHDRVVAGRTIGLDGRQDRLDGIGLGEVDLGKAGGAQFGIVERAAEQALNDAVIVGGREERDLLEAKLGLQVIAEALVIAQAVGFVFAADDADAEFLEVFSLDVTGKGDERDGAQKNFLQHGLSPVWPALPCLEVYGPSRGPFDPGRVKARPVPAVSGWRIA